MEVYSKQIVEILENRNCVFPFEYYICNFSTFSNHPYNSYSKYIKHILIDNSNINNEYAIKEYTTSVYKAYTDKNAQNSNKNQYRQIISLISQNSKITQKEMAKILEVSREKIKYNIAILKDMNVIDREGSNKIGKWKILK